MKMPVDAKFDVKFLIGEGADLTDAALERLIPSTSTVPASIHGAMRHSVFAGGKRLRPRSAIQAQQLLQARFRMGSETSALRSKMIHTYSLIHDDLPALDNDDLRRGKPTCHVVFGEAIAILAGDACRPRHTKFWLDCCNIHRAQHQQPSKSSGWLPRRQERSMA